MTRIVAGLEELKLVRRERDTHDRRVARVHLSAAGHRFVQRSRTRKNAYLAARLRALSADELATLDRATAILERVIEDST
jgi:DNA-binding MarR family transcriptional regulator